MRKDIVYEDRLPVNAQILTISSYPIHMHSDIQLMYVLEGEIDLTLAFETYKLKENDLHYIHSEDLHSITSKSETNLVVVLSINTNYVEKMYPNIRTTVFTMTTDKSLLLYYNQQMELKACIFLVLNEILQKSEGYEERIGAITKTLFEILHKDFRGFTVDKNSKAFVHKRLQDARQTERLCQIISDIYTNYVEPSTLEEISAGQNLNSYYLSHLFSQTVGINYRDFVNMVRVETSEYDLLASDFSISHIALSSGFSNAHYYIKHFQYWFGMSPQEYRKKNLGNTIGVKEPVIKVHNLNDYTAVIEENLKAAAAACENFPMTLANQTIRLDKLKFEENSRVCLNLNCYNPDFLFVEDAFFKSKAVLRPEFLKKYIDSVKVVIEEPAEEKVISGSAEMYASIENVLADLSHKYTCTFCLGSSRTDGVLFLENGIKTPLYYILKFLAADYEALHVNPNFIIIKNKADYHIMCWNLHLAQTKDIIIKGREMLENRLVTIGTMNVSQDNNTQSESWKGFEKAVLPAAARRIIEKSHAPEEHMILIEGNREMSVSIQLPRKSICFIDIVVF